MPPAELNSAEIEAALREHCDEVERDQILREARRAQHMREIARMRWHIAQQVHRLENGEPLDFEEYRFQEEIYKDEATDLVIMGSVQWGKALACDARVHTPSGWRLNGDLRVGDLVSTPFSGSSRITHVFPQGRVPIYRVTFEDGRSLETCSAHLWEARISKPKSNSSRSKFYTRNKQAATVSTAEIASNLEKGNRVTIPLSMPVEKPAKTLPIHPYFLGLMLGDGELTKGNVRLTTADAEIIAEASKHVPEGWELFNYPSDRFGYRIRQIGGVRRGRLPGGKYLHHPLHALLGSLGLLDTDCFTKFIPDIYKEGSIEQRFELLQGIFDSDGYASLSVSCNSSSLNLAKDIQEVVWSLGGIAKITPKLPTYTYKGEKRTGAISYKVNVRHPDPKRLFKLSRKRNRITDKYQFKDTLALKVSSVERVGEKEAQCIRIEDPRHLYVAQDYVVSHNSEFLICSAAAMAGMGLKVFFVCSKFEKRDKFVKQRIDPAFQSVPFYRKLYKQAEDRGAKSDSVRFKHFGAGHINFVGSNSPKDFTSYAEDVAIVDEHQECIPDNLSRIDSRLSGSPWQFRINVGNPRTAGTEQNRNLAWLYHQSDQRQWHVPCPVCKVPQILGWLEHYVNQDVNKSGGIVSVVPRDQDWDPKSILDMRPICALCKRPMNRLSKEGFWKPMKPGHWRHGYQLSNLYNPRQKASELYGKYIASKHSPSLLAEFWNDQLGMAWNFDGTSITDMMLQQASTGDLSGLSPYRFIPASVMKWRDAS